MKPKTEAQKRMLEMVQTLPELTDKEIAYYKEHCFADNIIESRGRLVCSSCGHSWKKKDADKMQGAKCPHCGRGAVVEHNKAVDKQIRYYVIASHINGFQVLRYIQVRRRTQANKVYHWHSDVGSIVFDALGDSTEFTLSRFTMSWIVDAWSFNSEIEMRRKDSRVLSCLSPNAILTKSIMPTLKRNGWKGELCGGDVAYLIKMLLTRPTIESLWKIGHHGYIEVFLQYPRITDEQQRLLKLATRHGFIFDTAYKWRDFMDYINDLKVLKKDIFNPSIIFPKDFEEAHRETHKKAQRKRDKEAELARRQRAIEQREAEFKRMQQESEKNKWINHYTTCFATMDFSRSGFRFKPLLTPEDFQNEADVMKHCIKSYYGKENTLLLSISSEGQKQETAEIDLDKGIVVQCRGKNNLPTPQHDTIVFMLNQYMRIFKAYNEGKFLKYSKNKQTINDKQAASKAQPAA